MFEEVPHRYKIEAAARETLVIKKPAVKLDSVQRGAVRKVFEVDS